VGTAYVWDTCLLLFLSCTHLNLLLAPLPVLQLCQALCLSLAPPLSCLSDIGGSLLLPCQYGSQCLCTPSLAYSP